MNSSVEFAKHHPEMANPSAQPHQMIRSAEVAKRHRIVMEAHRRAQKQGWEVVTVVNLHAFQLDLNMGALGHLTIPPRKSGEPYTKHPIHLYRIDMKDNGDANYEAIPVFPRELAEDITRYYHETGGVFFYEGDGQVPLDLLEHAQKRQLDWYWQLFQEGNANWAKFNRNPQHITARMRDAAKELKRLQLINVAPEWLVTSRADSPDTPCEGCGQIIPKVAKFCAHCETIYDDAWVKARRPDIWAKQNPAGSVATVLPGGIQGSGAKLDIQALINEELKSDKDKKK